MTLTFHEHFCGGGMARIGLGSQWSCVFANDIDPHKAASYVENFGAGEIVVDDVGNLTPADLPNGAVLAWASSPCQDISFAGMGAGLDGARSGAFWSFWRLIQALAPSRRPPLIVVENVVGLLTRGFDAICGALNDEGYRYGAVVIDAALFVPQSRERVFIVAIDRHLDIPADIAIEQPRLPFHPPALIAACMRQQTQPLWWRLPVPPKRNLALVDLIEDHPSGVAWHTRAETERLIEMMTPTNIAKLEEARSTGRRMAGTVFRRMRPASGSSDVAGQRVQRAEVRFDGVAGCLRVPTGGSSRQTIMIAEGASVRSRLLSPRECARLMGLPDSYRLPSNANEALGLMGDGVVALVIRHLAAHLLEPLLLLAIEEGRLKTRESV